MGLQEFRYQLIESIYAHMYQRVEDNYDYSRFSYDGVDRSQQVNALMHAQYLNFVLTNLESFYAASLLFADTASRELFTRIIKYRFLGHPHIRIRESMTWASAKAMYDKGASYGVRPSEVEFKGMFGPLVHHQGIPADDNTIQLDSWGINIGYGLGSNGHRQYYFARDGVRIQPDKGDYVIDGGACMGETAIFFASSIGSEGRVFSFDPLPAHVNLTNFNIRQNGMQERVKITPAGIGETSNGVAAIGSSMSDLASPGFSVLGREDQVPIVSIDDFVRDGKLPKVDFIKMDIEGFELPALKGAAASIAQHRPKLAIALYHKPQDFFEIPLYLRTQFPFYRLYLDHYTIFGEETVLYAVPE